MEKFMPQRPHHDQPFPHSMAYRLAGWASVARRYPIFGKTWFGYRMRSFIAPLAVLALILAFVGVLVQLRAEMPGLTLVLAMIWLVVALALFLGRALAVLVCMRQWPARRELAGIVCALLIGILLPLSLTPLTRIEQPQHQARVVPAHEIERARERERDAGISNLIIWFLVLVWLGGSFDLAAWFRQRRMLRESALLGEVERYRDERNEVEMQLAVLASQVEPHFLFNTLSGVRAAMLSDPARGIAMIDHLVDYLRATIPQLRADRAHMFVPLGSQVDAAQAYLGIIQARLPRLGSRIDCPPDLRQVAIPPLMLISLVENAVKHGIELKQGPGLIHIAAVRRQADGVDVLELSVADDGVGFGGATSGSGIGLANIRERLKHLYGGKASLSLRAADAGGVVASIVLPIRAMTHGGA